MEPQTAPAETFEIDPRISMDEYASRWYDIEDAGESSLWQLSAIALAVADEHGGSNARNRADALSEFASMVSHRRQYTTGTLRKYARTARVFRDPANRVEDLSFTHHRIAACHTPTDPEAHEAILKAAEPFITPDGKHKDKMSTRDLQDYLVNRNERMVTGRLQIGSKGLKSGGVYLATQVPPHMLGFDVKVTFTLIPPED